MNRIVRARIPALLLALLLILPLLTPAFAFADSAGPFSSEAEILTYIDTCKKAKESKFKFTCSAELYDQLTADGGWRLEHLKVHGGIKSSRNSLNRSAHEIELWSVLYGDIAWADCSTMEELHRAARTFGEKKLESFWLLCTPEVCAAVNDTYDIKAYLAMSGCEYGLVYSHSDSGIIEVSSITYDTDTPCAVGNNSLQFCAAIEAFEAQNAKTFTIAFEPTFYRSLIAGDREALQALLISSRLDDYSYMGRSGCALNFYSVTYSDVPHLLCRSEESIVQAFQQMGASGISDFMIYVPDKALAKKLGADKLETLHELETRGGVISVETMRYSMDYDRFTYIGASITSGEVVSLSSLQEAVDYVNAQVEAGADAFPLFCSPELYDLLLGDLTAQFSAIHSGMNRIYDLLAQAGIADFDLSVSESTHAIRVQVKQIFPGKAVVLAEQQGKTAELSPRLLELREASLALADELRTDDPLETARRIHDKLCEMTVYTLDDTTDEDDNAIGPILNGEANCDGYTDAFYLIGTLAGLNVRYQHGDCYGKDISSLLTGITHIWNLVEIDGSWRMVDSTWDDNPDGPCSYVWFNIGAERARLTHKWNEDISVPMAEDTDMTRRPATEFIVSTKAELDAAVKAITETKPDSFQVIYTDSTLAEGHNDLVWQLTQALHASLHYSWNPYLMMLEMTIA